jgi:DNA (cytosine-5)-methyltransferase 1
MSFTFLEFFAGGGMARIGLGADWQCQFANDFDKEKADVYRANFAPALELLVADIQSVSAQDIEGVAQLAWGSFPCQDLSLAGNGAGLNGSRSGMFWEYWRIVQELRNQNRAPELIAIENVYGAVTSNGGKDFLALIETIASGRYRVGAMIVDASLFVPQSRPRLFVIGVREDCAIPRGLVRADPDAVWHPAQVVKRFSELSTAAQQKWVWWRLPQPAIRSETLADLIEDEPQGVRWDEPHKTEHIVGLMAESHLRRLKAAQESRMKTVGAVYRRTRADVDGVKRQRAELRVDGLAGCLRTPSGGSSRQTILFIEKEQVKSRLLSPREAARLMGLPDSYKLPDDYNAAYHLAGDGVVASVVRHLAAHIFEPILNHRRSGTTDKDAQQESAYQLALATAV